MEPHDGPDGPPPPYSETDIHSYSQGSRSYHPSRADDDVSIAPSSSHSNIIDTPPESPHDAQYSFAGPGGGHHITASAQDYFDSRPPARQPGPNIHVTVEITPNAVPSDFPYPHWAPGRDVSEQDWQTFINYLIPGHAARANSHIIDRKLRAAGDAQSSADADANQAQSTPLKSSTSASVSPQNTDTVTREWNQGFFEPRGVTIRSATPAGPAAEPETQDRQDRGTSRASPADVDQDQSQPRQQSSWWRSPFAFVDGNNGSLRLGPLHIEGDRVAIGSRFEVGPSGVRLGGQPNAHPLFEASSRGVRWGGQPGPGLAHPHPPSHHGGPWTGPFDGGRGRGRDHGHEHGHRRRDHSRSSTSSSSSSSSSNSDSSIGSLPDWHDLKDVQLPVTKHAVQNWLSHPDQPVTKAMLKQAEAEIKAAKNVPPLPHDPAWDRSREALRREVKDLLQQFKVLKKQQKAAKRKSRKEARQQKRALRRERREAKRAEKHDRRAHEHESRRAERATRRAERDAERHARRFRHHHRPTVSPGPSVPGVPPVPPVPGIPTPPAPPAFPAFPGRGGGFWGRGSFGPRPSPPSGFGFGGRRGQESPAIAVERASRAAAEAVNAAAEQQRAAAAVAAEESRRTAAEAVARATVDAKLAQVRALESELSAMAAQVQDLGARIADAEKRDRGGEKSEKGRDSGPQFHDLRAMEQLENEMESLAQRVETLRFEADEEMAKGLAERDGEWGGRK
ncbi:hypothetical protein GGR55DRAFT_601641 [Xylaria sp. FL0064]|nr:hypothetical protein GGR55DRAFT_601641 [Xylaria sp. FL0064]